MNIYNNYTEKELVILLKQGDEQALSRLYYIHVKQLKYFVMKIAKSPLLAEDVVHDTFIKIWENRLQIDPEQSFKPYLYTIARRHLLNLFSRARHEHMILEAVKRYAVVAENSTELLLDYNESNYLFKEAITNLPKQCREIFIRCRLQGLTYKEAAVELGIAESTVNNQMVKALKSIRAFITVRNAIMLIFTCLVN